MKTREVIKSYFQASPVANITLDELITNIQKHGILHGTYRSFETIAREFRRVREQYTIALDYNPFPNYKNEEIEQKFFIMFGEFDLLFAKIRNKKPYDLIIYRKIGGYNELEKIYF